MLVCPTRACGEEDAPLEPLTPGLIMRILAFMGITSRTADALSQVARQLHQRQAFFCSSRMPVSDYRTILDAVYENDPYLTAP